MASPTTRFKKGKRSGSRNASLLLFAFFLRLRELFFQLSPVVFTCNVADAFVGVAAAGVAFVILEIEAVVKEEFLVSFDFSKGGDPDFVIFDKRLAIGIAAMVHETSRIFGNVPVDVPIIVEGKDVDGGFSRYFCDIELLPATLVGFILVDSLTNVLNNVGLLFDFIFREEASPVNAGAPNFAKFRVTSLAF